MIQLNKDLHVLLSDCFSHSHLGGVTYLIAISEPEQTVMNSLSGAVFNISNLNSLIIVDMPPLVDAQYVDIVNVVNPILSFSDMTKCHIRK